jgi:hypothetical protein
MLISILTKALFMRLKEKKKEKKKKRKKERKKEKERVAAERILSENDMFLAVWLEN